jgi:hypothetical protein
MNFEGQGARRQVGMSDTVVLPPLVVPAPEQKAKLSEQMGFTFASSSNELSL